MHLVAAFLFLLFPLIQGADVRFTSPSYQPSTGVGVVYAADSRWPLGSTQIVAFTTSWDEFRLEFWQQKLGGGGAKKSSQFNYTQEAGMKIPQSFRWTVQTYELQLSDSPVFFFWLVNNKNSSLKQTSAYFNITIDSVPSTPSSTGGLASLPTSTESAATSSGFSSATTSSTPIPSSSNTPDTPGGLSTGAAAGIGVGASLIVVLFGILAFVYLKRRRSQTAQWQQPEFLGTELEEHSIGSFKTGTTKIQHNLVPVEAPSRYSRSPAELA